MLCVRVLVFVRVQMHFHVVIFFLSLKVYFSFFLFFDLGGSKTLGTVIIQGEVIAQQSNTLAVLPLQKFVNDSVAEVQFYVTFTS